MEIRRHAPRRDLQTTRRYHGLLDQRTSLPTLLIASVKSSSFQDGIRSSLLGWCLRRNSETDESCGFASSE